MGSTKKSNPRVPPVPADFVQVAEGKTQHQLRQHYHVRIETIKVWQEATGTKKANTPPPVPPRRPVPDDFREVARGKPISQLIKIYKTGDKLIKRWLEECGMERSWGKKTIFVRNPLGYTANLTKTRNSTIYDDAADELRRARWVVYRCNDKGIYAAKGKWWRVGQVVCTPEELLERAERAKNKAA